MNTVNRKSQPGNIYTSQGGSRVSLCLHKMDSSSAAVPEGQEGEKARTSLSKNGVLDDDFVEECEGSGEREGEEPDEGQGVHSHLDHFREADHFFLLLNKLVRITDAICSGVYTPKTQGEEKAFLTNLSDHYIVKQLTFSKIVNEAAALMKKCVEILETYQNQPTLLDKHLPPMVEPLTDLLSLHLKSITPLPRLAGRSRCVSEPSLRVASPPREAPGQEGFRGWGPQAQRPAVSETTRPPARSSAFPAVACRDPPLSSSSDLHLKTNISACQDLASCLSLRLLLHLLYFLCKVRGYKAIRPLFSQQPELLEPLIDLSLSLFRWEVIAEEPSHTPLPQGNAAPSSLCPSSSSSFANHPPHTLEALGGGLGSRAFGKDIRACSSSTGERKDTLGDNLVRVIHNDHEALQRLASQLPLWSSHYTLLLWISLAVLAPFKLEVLDSSLSSARVDERHREEGASLDLPHKKTEEDAWHHHIEGTGEEGGLSKKILFLTEAYIRFSSTNASDAACVVLARFFSRSDVVSRKKQFLLLPQFLSFCKKVVLSVEKESQGNTSARFPSAVPGNERHELRPHQGNGGGGEEEWTDALREIQRLVLSSSSEQTTPVPLFAQANGVPYAVSAELFV